MEGGLFLVFIIIAMIARAIEAMAKGKQAPPQQGPQGRGQPQPRRQSPASLPQQHVPLPEYEEPYGTTARPRPQERQHAGAPGDVQPDATEDAAAAMIPDDLWEILTGRPKPQQSRPQPQPVPQYELEYADEAGVDEEIGAGEILYNEVAEYERRRRIEEAERELARQQLRERRLRDRDRYSVDKAPRVYSLERPLPPAAQRHAEFHAKIDSAPEVDRPRVTRRHRLFAGDDMKRAIVLQEVLGPPRGLE